MIDNIKYKVFSIESRKGGVGKSTMALNLSLSLISKGYKVLYLDCDISGTPISSASKHSVFWKNNVNVMEQEGKACNLLELYKYHYVNYKMDAGAIIDMLNYDPSKINIISSDIYGEDGKLLMDPRELTAELSSYWILEMIQNLSSSFAALDDRSTAIVIDNSPGYVGLGKSIRDWMTDLGPEISHFLIVSSIDEQDVEAVISSAVEIDMLMQAKNQIREKGAETQNLESLMSSDASIGRFYYTILDNNTKRVNDDVTDVTKYISIVFNKVPEDCLEAGLAYKLPVSDDQYNQMVHSLIEVDENGFPVNVIGYDKIISQQFISSKIAILGSNISYSSWTERISKRISYADDLEKETDKLQIIKNLDRSYKGLMNDLKKNGFAGLSKTFANNNAMSFVLSEINARVKDLSKTTFKKIQLPDDDLFIDQMREFNHTAIDDLIRDKSLEDYSSYLLSLIQELDRLTGMRKKKQNVQLVCNLSIMLQLFIVVQRKDYNVGDDYKQYLWDEYNNPNIVLPDWNRYLNSNKLAITFDYCLDVEDVMGFVKKNFNRFYTTMCYVLLRMMDSVQDFGIMLNAVLYTIQSDAPRVMNTPLKQYVNEVVGKKSIKYEQKKLESLAEQPFEMQVVQNFIKIRVLTKWL